MAGLALVVAAGLVWKREIDPPWAASQALTRAEVTERIGAEKAAELPDGIQQVWIEGLDRVDRCVTCHETVEWGDAMKDAPEPARSHPDPKLIARHPIDTFGCTLCHGGQGPATSVEAAHGRVPHWEEPLLDTETAERYGITRAELMEYRCAICHQSLDPVEGMPFLNAARERIFDCIDCHRLPDLEPGDNAKAPDLTHEGDKHPTKYTFPEDWTGPHTALAWHVSHLRDPRSTSPGSAMTNFHLKPKEAVGLALLVMSWRKNTLSPAWIPPKKE